MRVLTLPFCSGGVMKRIRLERTDGKWRRQPKGCHVRQGGNSSGWAGAALPLPDRIGSFQSTGDSCEEWYVSINVISLDPGLAHHRFLRRVAWRTR